MKDKKSMVNVPYIVYEKDIEHKNTVIKIMGTSIIFLIISIVATIWMFMSFIGKFNYNNFTQDGEGQNNINTGTQGDIINESTIKNND